MNEEKIQGTTRPPKPAPVHPFAIWIWEWGFISGLFSIAFGSAAYTCGLKTTMIRFEVLGLILCWFGMRAWWKAPVFGDLKNDSINIRAVILLLFAWVLICGTWYLVEGVQSR